ncbi:KilA-N domain-containing protein [Acinetobacter venetianus]|uniref:KilA-N domain-containing protein n=1 Tax=Acinetobacter venetianus TaxID=52133 RepID=UPI00214F7576|nr:KilA-N domain-containing protein [Acinetobacter venetianus]MCR4530842.1 KilA-N domain-containing protein [Acinetobacter venetianus]
MTSLTQNFLNQNNKPFVIGDFTIRQDEEGRYCLHDLHKASGGAEKHQPAFFIRNKQTKDLIAEIESEKHSANLQSAVKTINGGNSRGTYVVKELVYSYAMWISAKFHLTVIRAYDAMVMQWQINDRQSISPEQQALLHEIVARRSGGERKIYAEMWSRHNRHFKIPRYAELLAIHFAESVHYLETMVIKAKPEQTAMKALPFPAEVIQVAQQINNEFNGGRFMSWFVIAKDGVLSAQPLPHGYYPFNVKEFTRHFDGVLNILYGSDTLCQGRYFLSQE